MRELKFRGWDNKKKVYIDGSNTIQNWINRWANKKYINSLIFEQYTGLKDKSREVYQGDVYTWGVLTFPITIDDYHGYRFMFGKDQLVRAFIINGEYKGNIHESPEGPKE